jgi:hypothetical protein
LSTLRILFFATTCAVVGFAQGHDVPYQVHYVSNIDCSTASTPTCAGAPQPRPDSVINISNTGARGGVTDTSGTAASVGGSLCINVYTFDYQEEMASCCSCAVTPNGLISLSVQQDLISKTLTPAKPSSAVIKLVATVPVNGSCSNSAAAVNSPPAASNCAAVPAQPGCLAPGMVAWATTNHAGPLGVAWSTTETSFTPATLSADELSHLGRVCSFILGVGSTFGICRSCPTLGGQGAGAR